jgi:hydrogenase-4 component B
MALRVCAVAGVVLVAVAAGVAAVTALHGAVHLGSLLGPVPALRLDLGLTPLAAPFCALLAVLDLAVAVWSVTRGRTVDAALIAVFSASMLLVLLAQSVTTFFGAWEAMALSSVFLIAAHHDRRDVRRAAFTYLAISQFGALCVLLALALLARAAGDASFDAIARNASQLPVDVRNAVLWLALAGFGSKAGLIPLHFWLPRAHPVAPAHASALLSGAMLKVALYGLALVAFMLAAPAPLAWGIALALVGTISAVGGILYALVEPDLKRLLAYSSVENVGIIALGMGVAVVAGAAGQRAVAALALLAALFHAINHGLFKGLLFLGAGAIADSHGTADLERLGGAWRVLPWTAPAFLVGCAAIVGLPPFNGFASEWLTFQALAGALRGGTVTGSLTMVVAIGGLALTGGLALACFVKLFGVAFLGQPRRALELTPERPGVTTAAPYLLGALCVLLGIAPALVTAPLATIAGALAGEPLVPVALLGSLPATLALLPVFGILAALALAVQRGIRRVPTWTCGSPVGPQQQYTATAFSKPLRTIFAFVLAPQRERRTEGGPSPWFPQRIVYRTQSRYLIDEAVRRLTGATLRLAHRTRAVQSGHLRLYLAYALVTVVVIVVVAR